MQLADMRKRDPTAKALIFTQFNSTLEWLMARLTEEGYSYRTISGSMPLKKRSQVSSKTYWPDEIERVLALWPDGTSTSLRTQTLLTGNAFNFYYNLKTLAADLGHCSFTGRHKEGRANCPC